MFSFFKKKPVEPQAEPAPAALGTAAVATTEAPAAAAAPRQSWVDKLKSGLRKTGSSIATVFTGARIDDALYEDLESALLMADTGVRATQYLLDDLKRRVKETGTTEPQAVKGLLVESLASLLAVLYFGLFDGLTGATPGKRLQMRSRSRKR